MHILSSIKVDYSIRLTLVSVEVQYPTDLEDMIDMFKICATARLFLPDMFPAEDAGIFLDTDMVLHDDIVNLWDHFGKFDTVQFAGMAVTESSYGRLRSGGVRVSGRSLVHVRSRQKERA